MNTIDYLRANSAPSGDFTSQAKYLKENWDWLKYSYAIAIRVKGRMEELGLSQKKLAEELKCTQQHVSVLLNGRVNMTIETIAKLEKSLNIELIGSLMDSFYGGSPIGYLNEPGPGETIGPLHTKHLVAGYSCPERKKKGPKNRGK